jgi:hypothetical protein
MTAITIKEYFARDGSEFSKRDAAIIGPVLHEMSKDRGVTARDVVDAARSENSPLHSYFEWNDQKAADEYRLYQGRSMLRSIRIRYQEPGSGEIRESRAFQLVRNAPYEAEARTYRTFQVLHGDSAFAAQMLGAAYDDLAAWRNKYEPYTHIWQNFGDCFQQIVNQIEEWTEEYRAQSPAGETDTALANLLVWRDQSKDILATWTSCRESIGYVLEAIKNAETAFTKIDERKTRNCIKCEREFESIHSGHRLCTRCLNSKTVNQLKPDAAMAWDA